ncbi:MAG: zinc ribbon domain-containing protein [Candidatus Omnitrophica bacterium]|nr:zinc ribbon domain-containing protein [Candidatus Omnitrophota bacterium]
MPTYQYECDACGYSFDILQSMLDKKLKKCPQCGQTTLHRLIGAGSGIIFKGSGFYETDYKKKELSERTSGQRSSGTEGVKPEAEKCPLSDKTGCKGCREESGQAT